jgi:hypothetical protein
MHTRAHIFVPSICILRPSKDDNNVYASIGTLGCSDLVERKAFCLSNFSCRNMTTQSVQQHHTHHHQPWVEKYRPKNLNTISHQKEIVHTLQNVVQTGNLPHLLLYGPPGSGKVRNKYFYLFIYFFLEIALIRCELTHHSLPTQNHTHTHTTLK